MAYKLPVPASLVTGLGAAALVGFGAIANTAMEGNDSRVLGAVQSSVLTTRGDLPRRGASAWERFAASTADTFVGGDGTDVTVRTAAQALASIDAARSTAYEFSSSTGITLTNGNGTAVVTGGQLVMTTASGADTSTPNAPTASVAIPATIDPWRGVDVSVQLVGATGTLGATVNRTWLSLSNVADAKNSLLPTVGDWVVAMYGGPDGTVLVGDGANGTPFAQRGTSAAGVLLLDGLDWFRIVFRGDSYETYTGRGASRPTTWTRRYSGPLLGAATSQSPYPQPATVTLSGYRNGSQLQSHVVTFDNLAITGLL